LQHLLLLLLLSSPPGTVLKGVPNNLEFLAKLVEDPRFAAGDTTTKFLEDFHFSPRVMEVVLPGAPAAAAAAAAAASCQVCMWTCCHALCVKRRAKLLDVICGCSSSIAVLLLCWCTNKLSLHPAGLQTSVQDWPGRTQLWHVGVPPSGPMDSLHARLANALVGNDADAAVLEFGLTGPTIKFHCDCLVALTGVHSVVVYCW
jgi:hypothetical protein